MIFFLKVVNCETLIQTVSIEQIESNIETSWAKRIFNKLNMLGLGYIWNNANISLKYFPIIKQRIRDIYIHQWRTGFTESAKLENLKSTLNLRVI